MTGSPMSPEEDYSDARMTWSSEIKTGVDGEEVNGTTPIASDVELKGYTTSQIRYLYIKTGIKMNEPLYHL